ncbi:TPA: type IV secretion system protein, partial [Burkholderia contaminans]
MTLLGVMLIGVVTASSAYAVDWPPMTTGWSSSYQPGEVAKGAMAAIEEIAKIMKDLIELAVTLSQPLDQYANKMAGGLAGITIVLAGVRYAATRDPVPAWQSLIEDLAILGIFCSIFLMYATWAPGFYKW